MSKEKFQRIVRSILRGAGQITPDLKRFACEFAQKETGCSAEEARIWGQHLEKPTTHSPFLHR